MSKDGHQELAKGPRGVVVGVRLPDGSCPSEEFLAGLARNPQVQFKARLERLTTLGYLRNPDQMRDLEVRGEPKVWEIKTQSGWRLYVIQDRATWVATHGSKKRAPRKVPSEVFRAREIYKEWP